MSDLWVTSLDDWGRPYHVLEGHGVYVQPLINGQRVACVPLKLRRGQGEIYLFPDDRGKTISFVIRQVNPSTGLIGIAAQWCHGVPHGGQSLGDWVWLTHGAMDPNQLTWRSMDDLYNGQQLTLERFRCPPCENESIFIITENYAVLTPSKKEATEFRIHVRPGVTNTNFGQALTPYFSFTLISPRNTKHIQRS